MPIVNVDLSNSLEFFRTVTNQCILALNYITNNTYITTGTVRINPTSGGVSLNVSNGIISGNGSRIFSIPFTGITQQFLNSQLQNSSVTILSGTGVLSGGTATLGGSPAILLTATGIVDSKTNTSTLLPASANAIRSILDSINSIPKTEGIFKTNVGGTGIASYTNGQILLTASGTLVANRIGPNTGVIVTNGAGSITLSANLVQGANVTLTPQGTNGGMLITQNTLPTATFNTLGAIRLTDDYNTPSTNLGVSANALNTLSNYIVTRKNDGLSVNAFGRLVEVKTYTNGPLGNAASFVWTRPIGQAANFAYAIVTAVSPGGGSAGANNGFNLANAASQFKHVLASGGGAGASIVAIVTAEDLRLFGDNAGANTLTVNIGSIGLRGTRGGVAPGNAGTSAGNLTIGIRGTGDPPTSYLFHLEGGKAGKRGRVLTVGSAGSGDASVCIPVESVYTGAEIARVYSNTTYGTVLMKSAGMPGRPGILFSGGSAPSYSDPLLFTPTYKTGRFALGGEGGAPIYPLPFGDGFFPVTQIFGTPSQYIDDATQQHIGTTRLLPGAIFTPMLKTVQVSNTAGANNQVSSVIIDTSTRLNYGMGGEGPYSLFEYLDDTLGGISNTRIDVAGANGGFGYVRIESYVNA